ncbi:A/G-specific adenine glycosylase [Undibacterium cyanobacteriorum]|uniref:Adenine DNA glycosylase n=1 Tax=Undibacterium cyanobacteriorum TaxID=3073561 RepID=A0ABY9RJW2_9BURK|nr:A/G-specific adenine glycosylase [Undibacterium sp. 20NA77.5]WMW81482.1 A/G-specific adenine glycosylase [Undibacterium sp. 20NA77.5]
MSLQDPSFSADLIAWQKVYGRHSLPWQQTRDPYRVWLSEIMLQQTQVAAVIPYYQRFLERCPDVFALAEASHEEVMALWSGLGYYTRARNLHKCAKQVVEHYAGRFPSDPQLLQQLPGIGRSTAAAIAAFSYGVRAAILDGNVKRVFARVFGVEGYPGSKPIEDQLWLRAEALLPVSGIEAYTQGLMDLGASLCSRSKPNCRSCPFSQRCVAFHQDRTDELPHRKPATKAKQKYACMFLLRDGNQVLLEQRPALGIWGGLWSLPEVSGMQENPEPARAQFPQQQQRALEFAKQFGEVDKIAILAEMQHVFTHFRLEFRVLQVSMQCVSPTIQEARYQWFDLDTIDQVGLPAPIKTLLLQERDSLL